MGPWGNGHIVGDRTDGETTEQLGAIHEDIGGANEGRRMNNAHKRGTGRKNGWNLYTRERKKGEHTKRQACEMHKPCLWAPKPHGCILLQLKCVRYYSYW